MTALAPTTRRIAPTEVPWAVSETCKPANPLHRRQLRHTEHRGHPQCEVPSEPRARTDLRLAHPLTPQTKLVTVTDALRRVLAEQEEGLRQVTLVPVSKDPSREQRGPTDSLFRFDGLELQTYLTETEEVSTSA
jgi:hypothetical protein